MKKSMIQFSYDGLCLQFDKENLRYSILTGKTTWETDEFFRLFSGYNPVINRFTLKMPKYRSMNL